MADDSQDVVKVQVKFVTRLEKYRVTEKPFQVPVNLNRRGLSQVINHLLDLSATPVPFDFLIDNEFLRSTLDKYLQEHNRSLEEVITINYVELLDAPTPSSSSTHSDWIAAIDTRLLELNMSLKASGVKGSYIPYGAYDSQVCVLDQVKVNAEAAWQVGCHAQPVLGVSSYFRGDGVFDLASCSQDASVTVWNVDAVNQKAKETHSLVGHEGAVEHVEFDPTGKLLATCSWDDTIKIWDLNEGVLLEEPKERKSKKSKRKEAEEEPKVSTRLTVEARSTLNGHMQCVSVLKWMSTEKLVSGSWDHSLRFWDVESGVCLQHFDGNKVILSLDHSRTNGLILTGHADKTVRTWDPRVSVQTTTLTTAYVSHSGWVCAVAFHPSNDHIFISGSFDSNIKIWDIRSTTPLHTLPSQHLDKVTCLAWLDDDHFVSGGADKYLRTYTFPH